MENVAPPKAFEWAEQLAHELTDFEHEREVPRRKLTAEVLVRPVNADCTTFGEPFRAVTTDISAAGLGFLHTRAVSDKYLCVTFRNGTDTSILVEVMRCRPVGPLYEIGGEFVRKIEL
jgi:hypothetical protein